MRREWLARLLILFLLALAMGLTAWGAWQRSQSVLVHARMAETGGWTPKNLSIAVGEPLHLRLTSDDVMHSFAIGQSDRPPVDVIPGEVTELTLVFDKPGKYTFYCTRWCSLNHWRMRGVIDVIGLGDSASSAEVDSPLYVTLGLDIDAELHAEAIPEQKPSAQNGALFAQDIPDGYMSREDYLSLPPVKLWQMLRAETAFQHLNDQDVWDMVAYIWQAISTPQELQEGELLYRANCAACHGETGRGDGVFAQELAQPTGYGHSSTQSGQRTVRPTDFSNTEHMLAASSARLHGKILRGGMGTGMPYWGSIFTEEQIWALVAYLWKFQFE